MEEMRNGSKSSLAIYLFAFVTCLISFSVNVSGGFSILIGLLALNIVLTGFLSYREFSLIRVNNKRKLN